MNTHIHKLETIPASSGSVEDEVRYYCSICGEIWLSGGMHDESLDRARMEGYKRGYEEACRGLRKLDLESLTSVQLQLVIIRATPADLLDIRLMLPFLIHLSSVDRAHLEACIARRENILRKDIRRSLSKLEK